MKPDISRAIKILTRLREQLGSQYLSYWVLPNVILTLSGARAYCDGVFWDEDEKGLLEKWSQEIEESIKIINESTEVIWSEQGVKEARPGQKYAGYDLITKDGLQYVLRITKLLEDAPVDDIMAQSSAQKISDMIVANLKVQSKFKEYSKENLQHIAFGILAGYPDVAISETVSEWDKSDRFAEPSINADIRGADYYICPQPVYSYPRRLIGNLAIVDNEKLWSSLLKDYYHSDFHKALEKNRDFSAKMRELGILR